MSRLAACAVVIGLAGCAPAADAPASDASPAAAETPRVPRGELRMADDAGVVRAAARALMEADTAVALVTLDADGQPRVRTVRATLDPFSPDRPASGFTVWIKTRLTTRKVDQIRAHPRVTLYFSDDEKESYASVMGTAIVHTDPEHSGAKRHYDRAAAAIYWPEFPAGFVMLEVRPVWLEYIGPGVSNDAETWRPQAVTFE